MQESRRYAGKERGSKGRMQDRRDSGQEGCRKVRIQDRWDSGHGKPDRWDAKQEGFKTVWKQERRFQDVRDAEQERC